MPSEALAFERQWHVGLGVGLLQPKHADGLSLGVIGHAAYGLTDEFDARFTLGATQTRGTAPESRATWFSFSTLGLSYKLDIIEWVPYLGVRAGFFRFEHALPTYAKQGGSIGGMAGLDYSITRNTALGAEVGYDALLPQGALFTAVVRAEYRWGF
ncbi:MAG TPA: hypothetical protein VFQ61_08930 [Polyangiaceae bacterium]|nr:hypothetical protein [Polyangiaceae bacterium]